MDNRGAILLYETYNEIFMRLSDKQIGCLIKGLMEYQFKGTPQCFDDGLLEMAFVVIRQNIDRHNAEYQELIEKRREAGKTGSRKRWQGIANVANANNAIFVNSKNSNRTKENESKSKNEMQKKKTKDNNVVGASADDFDVNALNPPSISQKEAKTDPPDVSPKVETTVPRAASVSQSEAIQRRWNEFCDLNPQLAKVLLLSDKRKLKLKARLREPPFDFDAILAAFDKQPFLKGGNKQGWIASFDWLVDNSTNYLKVLELAYNKAAVADKLTDFVKAKYAQYAETAEADAENSEAEAEIIEGG
ncbi:MAG: DUF6291 domain-containing protein [Elusimicrobiota bacterium]|jgi:hypothetical protein|nr:DUF6291 domain-containing protein [Elusimicrobiota bacterium]